MIKMTDSVGLLLGSILMMPDCSTAPTPAMNPDAVRNMQQAFSIAEGAGPFATKGDPNLYRIGGIELLVQLVYFGSERQQVKFSRLIFSKRGDA